MVSMFAVPWDIKVCDKFVPYIGALNAFTQFIITIALCLRTWALYGRNTYVLIVTSCIGFTSVAIAGLGASEVDGELLSFRPLMACVPVRTSGHGKSVAFAWIILLAFDSLIFALTIFRTYRYAKTNNHVTSPLFKLLMRDGSMYFLCMCIVNAGNFIWFKLESQQVFAESTGTNSIMTLVVSVTLMSRLMLNLSHESHKRRSHTMVTNMSTDLVFTTMNQIMGNITAEFIYDSSDYTSTFSSRRPTTTDYSTEDDTAFSAPLSDHEDEPPDSAVEMLNLQRPDRHPHYTDVDGTSWA
ncbi:hypothetical protein BD410DRAFT_794242 [Rickenella mellea]|uniref:Uncharacterized protein n=1 Tax=Rickenella mellea TaxID=50990 RepID=A0A4Y7PRA5_9AGAM|nr:hypothetical protein BD410DRAFT_794242 [Rickenella mellea]